jgi:hypothetical protein
MMTKPMNTVFEQLRRTYLVTEGSGMTVALICLIGCSLGT